VLEVGVHVSPSVLLVDDEPAFLEAATRLLHDDRFEVLSASNSSEAVSKATASDIAVAVIDLHMGGDHTAGLDLAKTLRQVSPTTKLVFLTGTMNQGRSRADALGLSDVPWVQKALHGSSQSFQDLLSSLIDSRSVAALGPLANQSEPTETATDAIGSGDDGSLTSPGGASVFLLDTVDVLLYQAIQREPQLLHTLNWRTFERLLADVMETFGYQVELMAGTQDGGVDIVALRKDEDWGVHRYLLQAKRWNDHVGVEPVKQLMFEHIDRRATKSCLATTSRFTKGAWRVAANYKWQLELRDYDGIREWVEKAARIKSKVG
jgi:CheY-like chemotaxis protein